MRGKVECEHGGGRRAGGGRDTEPQTRTPHKDVGNNYFTIWLFNIAMENGPFLDDFPIKASIYKGFSMAMLNNQMVYHGFLWPGISSSLFGFLALEWSSGYFL